MNKRGQIWYGDFIIGLLVIIVISVAFYYVLYDIGNANSEIDLMQTNIESLSNNLMSDGYGDWNANQGKIGLVKNSKLDSALLTKFNSLPGSATEKYTKSKYLLGLNEYDYSAFIYHKDGTSEKLAPFLADETVISNAANVIRLDRLVYYNGEIVRLNIVLYK